MNAPTKARYAYCGTDLYTTAGTGEMAAILVPRHYKPDGTAPLVLYCHGAGSTGIGLAQFNDPVAPNNTKGLYYWPHRMAAAGYIVVAGDFGGLSTWGNALVTARMEAARVWAQGPPWYAKPGKCVITGGSMGSASCLNYYRTYPGNVACAVRSIPVSSINDIRNFNRGGYRDWVNTLAWGTPAGSTNDYPVHGTSYAALPGLGDPYDNLGSLAGLPDLCYYASDDPICTPALSVAVSNATLTKESHSVGALGHTDDAVNAMDMDRILEFMRAWAPLPTGVPV